MKVKLKQIWIIILLGGWCILPFTLKALHHISNYDFIVAPDGSGDFESVQEAIDASKAFPDDRVRIFIKNGIYEEKVTVHSWNNRMTIMGENKEHTIIRWDDDFDKINRGRNSTFHTYTLLVQGEDFHAENITIENSAGETGQAIALFVDADRVSFINCKLLGNQDTLYLSGEGARQYFKDCYIEGTTDFIFGDATGFFEECILHSKKNSYITAASTPGNATYGLVFKKCKLTAEADVDEVYLGRPWRDFAKTVFIQTQMDDHILPQGWHNWSRPEAEESVFYAEYDNTGPGYTPDSRVEWSHQLTEEESKEYTREKIFKGWIPEKESMK